MSGSHKYEDIITRALHQVQPGSHEIAELDKFHQQQQKDSHGIRALMLELQLQAVRCNYDEQPKFEFQGCLIAGISNQ